MSYKPAPIDNSHVELGKDLLDLVETLARNNHDLWARRRAEEGWRYGRQRSEKRKETPLLVSYEDLPDSEKQYDRDNAAETLKTIVALGGRVEAPRRTAEAKESSEQTVSGLLAFWRTRKPGQFTLQQHRDLGKQANSIGESLTAYDVADDGLKKWSKDRELRKIKALALARMGTTADAQAILLQLRKEAPNDPETLGLLARTYKDLWIHTGETRRLKQAYNGYAEAYRLSPGMYWTGINAATLAFAAGERKKAAHHAARIRKACLGRLKSASGDEVYWLTATLAEAALICEDFADAEKRYAEAARIARNNLGYLSTTRRNAKIIFALLPPETAARIDQALQMPHVAVFAGHRVDEPGRAQRRFPNGLSPLVGDAIKKQLVDSNIRVGYSSAASGSDILFAEAMLAIGGRIHLVLPCNEDQFIRESVASSGVDWTKRFARITKSADEVIIASDQRLQFGSIAYDYANELLHGLATMRANQLETKLARIAVWDGAPGYGPGGTADIVARWRSGGHAVSIINPLQWIKGEKGTVRRRPRRSLRSAGTPSPSPAGAGFASEIGAMIFADAYHFSKLSEEQMPNFIAHFAGPIAALAREAKPAPLYQNTWGDGLFFVFREVCDAARFALELAECAAGIDRQAAGLPPNMSLRIAVHVGPIYRFEDQIIGKMNYIGSHVNRAARIEPVTPPGQVYSSDAFAALTALQAPGRFRFDYIGRIPLAKSFGEFPMYHLQKV